MGSSTFLIPSRNYVQLSHLGRVKAPGPNKQHLPIKLKKQEADPTQLRNFHSGWLMLGKTGIEKVILSMGRQFWRISCNCPLRHMLVLGHFILGEGTRKRNQSYNFLNPQKIASTLGLSGDIRPQRRGMLEVEGGSGNTLLEAKERRRRREQGVCRRKTGKRDNI